jgi:tetratricopeptide (TPR) repeat protein
MKRLPVLSLILIFTLIAALSLGCSRDPNVRKQKYFASGQQYFQQGKYQEAAIQFSNATDIDPRFAEAHYRLAQTYLKLQDWNRAYQELNRTVELQPENYPAHLDLANLLIQGRDFKGAQTQIALLQSKQPNKPELHLAIASLLAAQGNLPGALQEDQKAIALAPESAESYLSLALLQLRTDQSQAAEASFKKAIELNPGGSDAHMDLGTYYASHHRPADAEQEFRQAMKLNPKDPSPWAAIARLYLAEGKKAQAEAFLKQGTQAFPSDSQGYRMLGDFYFATGDLDKATAEYATLEHYHPDDWRVKKNYTQLLILKNRLDEASQLDDEILKSFPGDSDALIYRAQIQVRQGHPNGAVATLQTVIKNDPTNAMAHYHLGVAYDRLDNSGQAQNEWRQALQFHPGMMDALRALAALAAQQGDMPGLEQWATQIIQQQPASPEGYAMRALSFTRRGQFSSAEQDAGKAISLGQQDPMGYIQMGNLKLAEKQYSAAEKAYRQALALAPSSSDALSGLMNTFLAQKQVDAAIAAAKAQIARVSDSSAFYDLLGTVLFNNKKDLDGAETALAKSASLDKANTDALLKLGQVQLAKGSAAAAIATYQQSAKDNPHEITFKILLGELYDKQHASAQAQAAYRKALEIDPDNALACNNLAYLLLENGGNVDEAVSLAQTARRAAPDSSSAADTLGWAYYRKGFYSQSVDLFQQALKLAQKANRPDNPNLHYHLGLAYQKTGQTAQAKQELEHVLKTDPNYGKADDVKRALATL